MPSFSFHLRPVEITGFGIMVAIGALVGLRVFRTELAARFLPQQAADVGFFGVAGNFHP